MLYSSGSSVSKMAKGREFSEETVQDITARIHHHRQAAEIVKSAIGLFVEYLQAATPEEAEAHSEDELVAAMHALISRLHTYAEEVQRQLESDSSEVATTLRAEWHTLAETLAALAPRSDAASIPGIRTGAIAARHLAGRTLAAKGTLRRKEPAKEARAAALHLHRLASEYELHRVQQLLTATTEELLVPINILEGTPVHRATVKPANVLEVVRESIRLHTAAAHRRGIEFREEFQFATAYVALSADELLRALANLFSNAIKYMGTLNPHDHYDHTWITVHLTATATLVRIGVESWGAPITPEELRSEALFEWGRRGHFSWKVAGAEGSGVGLHDTRMIVSRVGGRVTIATDPVERFAPFVNKMTTVTLHLPRLDD